MQIGLRAIAILGCLLAGGCATAPGTVGAITSSAYPAATSPVRSSAIPVPASALTDGTAPAALPAGFASFCLRFPDQCETVGGAGKVELTAANWLAMEAVNDKVNGEISPLDDQKHYGRAEYWTIPTDGYGDCEDYALTKRRDLAAQGFPMAALRVAVVNTWRGERHAVLTVTTNQGDYVLDNLRQDIVSPDRTDYQWVERQDAAHARNWVALGPARDPTYLATAAARPLGAAR